jgi:1-acyl-sn-glycerol-3-phosphate acyltransferase
MNGSWLLGLSRVIPYMILTLAMMPVQALALRLNLPLAASWPRQYHAICCRILGIQIVVRGTSSFRRPTLFVSNHSSYMDIQILGSLIDSSFVAKSDMIGWPIIGKLAQLQRSVFIDRKPANAGEHSNEVGRRLAAGDNLVLFAEGTTSDGNRLLPFKSSLLSVAENIPPEHGLVIQPVSIIATALDGMPLGRAMRPLYAWYGDMPLAPHAWAIMKAGRLTVEVEFHEPFTAEGMNRKQLTARCEAAVESGVVRSITGRVATDAPSARKADEGDEIEAAA